MSTATGRDQRRIGALYALAAITAWGVYFPFARLILAKIEPAPFLVFRFGIGAVVLTLMCLRLRRPLAITRDDIVPIVVAGLIGIVAHQLLQLNGLKHTTATNTGWILTLIPPVIAVLGWVFLGERLRGRTAAGLLVAMAGVLAFVTNGRVTEFSIGSNRGDLFALASVFTWSTCVVILRWKLPRYDPLPLTAFHMALGAVAFVALGHRGLVAAATALAPTDWVIVVAIGVVPSGLAYYWWNAGLKRLTAVNTALFLFIEAIIASLAGFLVLGEEFTMQMVLAAVVIVAGVVLAQSRRRQ